MVWTVRNFVSIAETKLLSTLSSKYEMMMHTPREETTFICHLFLQKRYLWRIYWLHVSCVWQPCKLEQRRISIENYAFHLWLDGPPLVQAGVVLLSGEAKTRPLTDRCALAGWGILRGLADCDLCSLFSMSVTEHNMAVGFNDGDQNLEPNLSAPENIEKTANTEKTAIITSIMINVYSVYINSIYFRLLRLFSDTWWQVGDLRVRRLVVVCV